MLGEDIYREFVVRKIETEMDGDRTILEYHLEGWHGHKVAFRLTIKGCSGEKSYRAQYDAIAGYCKVGSLLNCGIVYRRRNSAFVMCIDELMLMTPIRLDTGSEIDVDVYLNPNRGFWVRTRSASDWIHIPGVIELSGQACIPLVEENRLPLVEFRYNYDTGLQYGKRLNMAQRAWRWAFAP